MEEPRDRSLTMMFMAYGLSRQDIGSWHTPNTYDNSYLPVPHASGIYIIAITDPFKKEMEILYVGSAKDLFVRYQRHEVLRILRIVYPFVTFYFRQTAEYKTEEGELIYEIQPRFNNRGIRG